MNISGIRPRQGFYDSVIAQEPEKEKVYKLNQVEIVGAGPGDPDLVSVRGRR